LAWRVTEICTLYTTDLCVQATSQTVLQTGIPDRWPGADGLSI